MAEAPNHSAETGRTVFHNMVGFASESALKKKPIAGLVAKVAGGSGRLCSPLNCPIIPAPPLKPSRLPAVNRDLYESYSIIHLNLSLPSCSCRGIQLL